MRRVMIGAILTLVLMSVGAWAQTSGTEAFAQLPPVEQKIARALFEAQTGPTRLTPDQIVDMKKGGEGHRPPASPSGRRGPARSTLAGGPQDRRARFARAVVPPRAHRRLLPRGEVRAGARLGPCERVAGVAADGHRPGGRAPARVP